ncbi:hypothetical protein Tco_0492176 [Tanacetum coccineum]
MKEKISSNDADADDDVTVKGHKRKIENLYGIESEDCNEPISKKTKTVKEDVCHDQPSVDLKQELYKFYYVPLEAEHWKSYVDFCKLVSNTRFFRGLSQKLVEMEKNSIEQDHPYVCATGEFAVATFNKLREMILKKGEQKKLHDYEIMEFQYLKLFKVFYFYMTIEAFEEGNLGVYEAKIVCNRVDGKRTLTKFVLTDRTPAGKKAMAMSSLCRLKSICKTVEGLKKDIEIHLDTTHKYTKGEDNGKAAATLIRLKKRYEKAMKGLGKVLYGDTRSLACSPVIKRGVSGMVRRPKGTTCKGYDYYNPLKVEEYIGVGYEYNCIFGLTYDFPVIR